MENGDLFAQKEVSSDKAQRPPKPPKLRRVCSLSTSVPAADFFKLLQEARVTAVLDTRLTRAYDNARFAHEKDFEYIVGLHGIRYAHAVQLAPTKEMREEFERTFKGLKRAPDRDPNAWTRFLEQYGSLMMERKVLRDGLVREVLYGDHEAVAVLCHCPHHDDCHRSYACGMIANYLDGVQLQVLYPDGVEPRKATPRRYRLHDFSHARLRTNATGRGGK